MTLFAMTQTMNDTPPPANDAEKIYPGGEKRFGAGRPPAKVEMTAGQIDQAAVQMLRNGLSPQMSKVIDALANGGAMTASQLKRVSGLSHLTFDTKYQAASILDRVRMHDLTPERLIAAGVTGDKGGAAVYTLGAVGMRIAERRRGDHKPVPNAYTHFNGTRILHDLIVNEIVLRLTAKAGERGWQLEWIDRARATVCDERGVAILEPDALLLLKRPGFERMYALEYHNEDRGHRAALKVEKYQAAYLSGRWKQAWDTEVMPPVLSVFLHELIGANYVSAVERQAKTGLKVKFIGKPWGANDDIEQGWVDCKTLQTALPLRVPQPAKAEE